MPIIVTTGSGCEETAVEALRSGAYDYIINDPDRNYLKILPLTMANAIRRKKTELRMAMLSHAMMDIGDSVYITDMDETIVFVNTRFLKMYGYTEDEILGVSAAELMPDMSNEMNEYEPEGNRRLDFFHRRKDGTQFPAHIPQSVIQDDTGKKMAVVGIVRDLTEQRVMEEKRIQSERLKTAIEMAGAACHELNQPLQAIAGYTDLILLDTEPGTEIDESLRQIKSQIDRMAGITRKLNSITRYETTHYIEGMRIVDIEKASSR
jgi:PAS domain S-box-containing protein